MPDEDNIQPTPQAEPPDPPPSLPPEYEERGGPNEYDTKIIRRDDSE